MLLTVKIPDLRCCLNNNLLNANVAKMVYKNCHKSIKVLKRVVILCYTRHRHTLNPTYIIYIHRPDPMSRRPDFLGVFLLLILTFLAGGIAEAGLSRGLVDVKNYSSASGPSLKMIQNMVQDDLKYGVKFVHLRGFRLPAGDAGGGLCG